MSPRTEELPRSVRLRLPRDMPAMGPSLKRGEPCTLVILGAGGDLTSRKLLPALAHLSHDGLLDDAFTVIGVARQDMDDAAFRERMREAVRESEDSDGLTDEDWRAFEKRLFYVRGDLRDEGLYGRLEERIEELETSPGRGRLFYLAIPPSVYETTLEALARSGVAPRRVRGQRPWCRIIVEKPFGRSLDSARELNRTIGEWFEEHQVYRIDHYLGKETVQNLLVFRFANSIFEPIWNRAHVHHVQITAAESVGVEHRAGYYEEAGVVRDMFQNHLLQLLSLTAMEAPAAFRSEAVRDEKSKVLKAIRPVDVEDLDAYAVRGQYGAGTPDGSAVPAYRDEPGVAKDSDVPTFAALRVFVDNWRWQGVPFYLRSGKRMPRRATEIAIRFRHPPHLMFPPDAGRALQANLLTFGIQPRERISLCMEIKVPGIGVRMAPVQMEFDYDEAFDESTRHSAYETLLLDAMAGDQTLFARSDAVEAAWAVVDPVIEAWEEDPGPVPVYAAGTWGPEAAVDLAAQDRVVWRRPA